MRFLLLSIALLLPAAGPATAAPDAYLCTGPLGEAPFSLTFTRRGDWNGDYEVVQSGADAASAGKGTLSLLDGGTSYEIVDGPLKDVLKARFLQPDSATVLHIDGPQSGRYRCEKPT